jgi:hypothetical protein
VDSEEWRRLAAAIDIAAVLAVRAEVVALIREALAAGDSPAPRELCSRARELRLQAETVAGELLISMLARGL